MDKSKDPKEQFILSRDAVGLANKAFFDPSMMGLLYFVSATRRVCKCKLTRQPDEHKLAVYTPLFAPVAVPIVLGLIKEISGWRRRRRARKAAEAAEAAGPVVEVDVAKVEVKNETNSDLAPEVPVAEPREDVSRDSPPIRTLRPRKKIIE